MDFTQKKLTKEEWEFLEIPVRENEMKILKLIHNSYDDVSYTYNEHLSMLSTMKMPSNDMMHYYIFMNYFKKTIMEINKITNINIEKKKIKVKLKKIDELRIRNISKKIENMKSNIYEYILLNITKKFIVNQDSVYYYTLTQMLKNNILNLNYFKT